MKLLFNLVEKQSAVPSDLGKLSFIYQCCIRSPYEETVSVNP